jgi:hypothetical protein
VSEVRQVPDATFTSYYGRPILKVSRWAEPHLPAYLFLGELSGAGAVLGAVAAATGRPQLARAARLTAIAGAAGGGAFLAAELGRPDRFINMLRVAKPTSPMSMGSWILTAHSGLAVAAAASDLTGVLRRAGAVAGGASAVTGPLLAAYPAVLLGNTAVPAWHAGYRQLAALFTGGAMTAAAAAGLAASCLPGGAAGTGPAARLAVLGAAVESAAGFSLERTLGPAGEPYQQGSAGRLLTAARLMTLSGGAAALAAPRSRLAAVASAALLSGGGLCAKFGVLRAGKASAADPKYVVQQQRANGHPPAAGP